MDGKTVQLAQYRGEPVVVSFFAAWRQPREGCSGRGEVPAADYRGRVQVLSVARASGLSGAERFIRDNGITWPCCGTAATPSPPTSASSASPPPS